MKLRIALAVVAGLALVAAFARSGSALDGVGVPAQVVDVTKETSTQSHPTTDYGTSPSAVDDRVGTTTWRVVKDTGNCCENHLTTSPDGRLFNIGGSFVNYTDDRGLTWKSVQPLEPLVNGEGSMAMAPNGDVIAMTWDAYSGDHFVAYKYDAASGMWFTLDNPVHEPFYDRPWLTVVPGPFAIGLGADTVPYIALVQGGTGLKDPMFMSTDGLSYTELSSPLLDAQTRTPVSSWFPVHADPSFDWIQPIRSAPATPLGGGHAVGVSDNTSGVFLLDPSDRHWDPWTLPDGSQPPTYIQVDSAGRIHNVRSVGSNQLDYRISADGGRTWTSAIVPLPFGGLTDFKVNAAAGVSAVALRLDSQDWVYKFDITGDTARLIRRYRVGLGDNPAGSDVGALTSPRMDFQSVAIFADGRVAVSFLDSTTLSHPPGTGVLGRITPAVAIELDTNLPPVDLSASAPAIAAARAKGGDLLTFSAKVANVGDGGAADVVVRFVVDGTQFGADRTLAGLAPGASEVVSSDAWNAAKQDGQHTVQVVVDPAGTVAESSEANNAASSTFRIKGGRLG